MFDGRCSCGSSRYRMQREPMFVHCCHCTFCQRESGSAFVINGIVELSAIETLDGDIACVETPTAGKDPQLIYRCQNCRVALWSAYGGMRGVAFVRLGTLNEPHRFPPDIHIYTSTRRVWVALEPGIPAVSEYYRHEDYWPPAAIERYRHATAGIA